MDSGTTGSFGVPAQKDDKHSPPDIKVLDGYALERWEAGHLLDFISVY